VVECLADVEPEPVDWAWKNRLARGKLNLIGGPAGLGKSQLLLDIAKVITTGGVWPDGTICRLGSVLLLQNEDNLADTVAPRAQAAGVDTSRLFYLRGVREDTAKGLQERLVQLDRDLGEVEAWLDKRPDVDTLTIDPLNAYLGKADSYKDADVRAVLTPLAALAERRRLMVIVLAHLNKGSGRAASERIAGSPAFARCREPRTWSRRTPMIAGFGYSSRSSATSGRGARGLPFVSLLRKFIPPNTQRALKHHAWIGRVVGPSIWTMR
jgi:RecA-family ATPase